MPPGYCRVVVAGATFAFDRDFDYRIPEELLGRVAVGARVIVPFGRGNHKRTALVTGLCEAPAFEAPKPILSLVDEEPILSEEMLALMQYLAETTYCARYEAARLMIPIGYELTFDCGYRLVREPAAGEILSPTETEILRLLREARGEVTGERLAADLGLREPSRAVARLIRWGIVASDEHGRRRVGEKTERMVRLAPGSGEPERPLTPKQRAVVELLEAVGAGSVSEIAEHAGVTRAVLDNLVRQGVLERFDREVLRSPFRDAPPPAAEPIRLTDEQQAVFAGLRERLDQPDPGTALLYGVTGSGKTCIYMRLIEEVLDRGRQVVVLVPEISLTPQLLEEFRRRFGSRVAAMHSSLSMGERLDEYKRMRAGEADIVVGARSAIFAPFDRIGLIILDEEQERTYKSEMSPRYHTREVALFRRQHHRSLLLFASATPSIETFYRAKRGQYSLFTLKNRYGPARLPEVTIVDMKDELRLGNRSALSGVLLDELAGNLERGEQSIVLLNRRGQNTVLTCIECGAVLECPNCSVAMTYHRVGDYLMCHTCGHIEHPPFTCRKCGGRTIKYDGSGTQRVEEELASLLPGARILRMDLDTTGSRFSHERCFGSFARGEYDILIGTQMVAKGLNFPRVTLVGVLGIDGAMYGGDFRGAERAFSLITQVVGRCGRGELPGRAFIQTVNPQNAVIAMAARQDYDAFFKEEILARKLMLYPPFCSMALAAFLGEEETAARGAAMAFFAAFRQIAAARYNDLPIRLLGPIPARILRAGGRYRYKLLIKYRESARFRQLMLEALDAFRSTPEYRLVQMFIDSDYDGY